MLAASDYGLRRAKRRPQSKANTCTADVNLVHLEAAELEAASSNLQETSREMRNPENCCVNSKGGMQNPTVHPDGNVESPPQNVCAMPIVPPPNDEIVMLHRQVEQLQDNM